MAPMLMCGCNGMMGPMNGMMGGMMNPAAMRRMMEDVAAGEDAEEEVHDYDDVGAVQDAPPPQPAAASASVVAQPVAPAVPVPAQPEHQPPPVLPYNKSDDAAITRSASMIRGIPMTRLSYAIEKLVPALDAGYTSGLTQRGVTSYDDLGNRFKKAHDRIKDSCEGFPDNIVQELPLVLGDAEVNDVAVAQGWKDEFLKPVSCAKAPPPSVAEFFAGRHPAAAPVPALSHPPARNSSIASIAPIAVTTSKAAPPAPASPAAEAAAPPAPARPAAEAAVRDATPPAEPSPNGDAQGAEPSPAVDPAVEPSPAAEAAAVTVPAADGDGPPICLICQQEMTNGAMKTLGCGHTYHLSCMEGWYTATSNFEERCPLRCQITPPAGDRAVRGADDFEVVDFM
ncbi:unnamed protein product [Cladocopium goreaui]|uniref:RING-type domain-containing protein n=1 Tax=Cladocopium goreaui TaxID=2562237 RepID=A0A9P1DTP7_9DINO|nr:unnamed protein product [Cladocopium goreaui]CAI4015286.1 unnamed protein product [Cladocopium goreaui]